MDNVHRRLSGTIRTTIIGLSIGCLTLAGCSSSPTLTAAKAPGVASTPAATKPQVGADMTTSSPVPAPAPAKDAHAPPEASTTPKIGPNGFGGLLLGMTFQQAKAAGFVRGNESADRPCGTYEMYFHGERYGRVFISPDRGVEAIGPEHPVRTADGVTLGAPVARVATVYPDVYADLELGRVRVRVPGNPGAHYRLAFDHDTVAGIALQRADQRCYE